MQTGRKSVGIPRGFLNSPPPAFHGREGNTQALGRFGVRQAADLFQPLNRDSPARSPEPLPVGLRPCQSRLDPLRYPRPLKLGDGPQDMEL